MTFFMFIFFYQIIYLYLKKVEKLQNYSLDLEEKKLGKRLTLEAIPATIR